MKPLVIQWIERVNRNLCLLGVALLVAAGGLAGWDYFKLRAEVYSPTAKDFSELTRVSSAAELGFDWADVQGERTIDTGYESVESGTYGGRERKAGSFVALVSGENILIVKVKRLTQGTRFRGRVVDLPFNVKEEVIGPLIVRYPNTEGHFLPVMLVESGVSSLELAVGTLALAFLVLGLFVLYRGARAMEEPYRYPALRRVVGWNEPRDVLGRLEGELRDAAHRLELGQVVVTSSWMVARGWFRLELAELSEIAWMFKAPRGTWDFSPLRTLTIYLQKGERLELALREAECDRLISEVAIRVPWIVTGYNRNIEVLWISDRRAFLSELNSRREKANVSGTAASA